MMMGNVMRKEKPDSRGRVRKRLTQAQSGAGRKQTILARAARPGLSKYPRAVPYGHPASLAGLLCRVALAAGLKEYRHRAAIADRA
jgi:hypothetical protein